MAFLFVVVVQLYRSRSPPAPTQLGKGASELVSEWGEKKVPFLAFFGAQESPSCLPTIGREIWVIPAAVALTYSAPLIKGVILPVINLESY